MSERLRRASLRARLRERLPLLRKGWYLAHDVAAAVADGPRRNRAVVARQYVHGDPWRYEASAREQQRLYRLAQVLDDVRGLRKFERSLEVGCGEGAFTHLLAARSDRVVATDVSTAALARARAQLDTDSRIRLLEWDLRVDALDGQFDLIVASAVLEYLRRPRALANARAKLVAGLVPGGHLVVLTTREDQLSERAWWGRRLLRGKWINAFVAADPRLRVVREDDLGWYTITVLEKRA